MHIISKGFDFSLNQILPCNQTTGGNLFNRVQIWFESIWSFLKKIQKKRRKEKEKGERAPGTDSSPQPKTAHGPPE
jgi:hypothetical protein